MATSSAGEWLDRTPTALIELYGRAWCPTTPRRTAVRVYNDFMERDPPADARFVSQPITPDAGTFDALAMARGEPGLPTGFTWEGRHYTIRTVLSDWKYSEPWDHARGERYYRKHYYKVLVDTNEVMTLYAVRHVKAGQSRRKRWWLYTIEPRASAPD